MYKVSSWRHYEISKALFHYKSDSRSVAHLRGRLHALLLLHALHVLLILLLVGLLLLAVAVHLHREVMALRVCGLYCDVCYKCFYPTSSAWAAV